jgi:hypothetical protein
MSRSIRGTRARGVATVLSRSVPRSVPRSVHRSLRAHSPLGASGIYASRTGRTYRFQTVEARAAPLAAATTATTTAFLNAVHVAFRADPISFLTSLAACIGSIAFAVLLIAAIPALIAFRRTMEATEVLVESLQEELPDTLAAMRLSGLELTDAIEEVSGLGSDLTAGLRASARALVGAESGVREGAKVATEMVRDGTPVARRMAERALLRRSKMEYSKGTVASVAQGAKVASKRLRFALAAANAGNVGRNRRERCVDPYAYPYDPADGADGE